jgi:hypothetical protein
MFVKIIKAKKSKILANTKGRVYKTRPAVELPASHLMLAGNNLSLPIILAIL